LIVSERLLAPVDIVVDSREASKNQDVVEELKRRGLRVAVLELSAGDYYLPAPQPSRAVLVERKTVTDFLNSIRDNRVWDQARRLRQAAETEGVKVVIVLEGWLGVVEKRTRWRLSSVLRVLDELILDWGIPVLPSHSKRATVEWLAAKAKSLGRADEKRILRLRVEKKPPGLRERILYVAEGLAGPVLARRLLARFRTLRRLANASVSELMEVEGIGEKRAREIYAVLNTPWDEGEEAGGDARGQKRG